MRPQEVACIVNPRSHTVRRQGSVLQEVCALWPGAHLLWLNDFDRLPERLNALADTGVRTVCIEGGDGTVLAVLSACLAPDSRFAIPPEFAVLPGGSTNLAHDVLGLQVGIPAQILSHLQDPNAPERVEQRALHLRSEALPVPQTGFLLSTGSLARAMGYVQREFHGEGRRGAGAIAGAIARFALAPGRYTDTDGKPLLRASDYALRAPDLQIAGPHCLSIATPLPRLSLGLSPFWGTGPGGIGLTCLDWPVQGLRRALLRILSGKALHRLENRGFRSYRVDMFELTHTDALMLDGEPLPIAGDGILHVSLTEPLVFLR